MTSARWTWTLTQSVAVEADIREEIEAHLDAAVADRIAAGMDPERARREALARFGDVERIVGACRTVKLEEHIMLQRALLALVAILSIAVVVQAYQLNASQARTNEALAEVRHDFAAAAERIETALHFVEVPTNSAAPREELQEPSVEDDLFRGSGEAPAEHPSGIDWDSSQVPEDRIEVVGKLAARGASAVPSLLVAAQDPDVLVRLAAVEALAEVGNLRACGVLDQLEYKDPEPLVRRAAEGAAARIRERTTLERETLEEGADFIIWEPKLSAAARFEALQDLHAIGDPSVSVLIEFAGDADVFVRTSAVRMLGELAHPDAKAVLVELSKLDPQAIVREEAEEALLRYDD